jgi:tetratricopeptide (TPR) repeat protein
MNLGAGAQAAGRGLHGSGNAVDRAASRESVVRDLFKRGALPAAVLCAIMTGSGWAAEEVTENPAGKAFHCKTHDPEVAAGYALAQSGRFAEARVHFESALVSAEGKGILDAPQRACLMRMIGYAETRSVRGERAIPWFRRALEQRPLPVPLVALLTADLAYAYSEIGWLDQGEPVARDAVHLTEQAFGADHPDSLSAQSTLAGIYFARGDVARAEPVYRRILDRLQRTQGPDAYEVALAASNLGVVYLAAGRNSEARNLLRDALAGLSRTPMKRDDEAPMVEAELALAEARYGEAREAEKLIQEVMATLEKSIGPEHPSFPVIVELAATAKLKLGEREPARELFHRAISALESRYGPSSTEVVAAGRRYAGVLNAGKDKKGAKQIRARLGIALNR